MNTGYLPTLWAAIAITALCPADNALAQARAAPSQPAAAQSQPRPSAAERISQGGPEESELKQRVGSWDVVASLRKTPGAAPVVTRGLIAERTMIGPILQEIIRPAPGTKTPDFQRLDYLNFDRVEGRWKYVSMDTRFPVSIMPAWSMGPAVNGKLDLLFAPQAFVGFGEAVEGRLMISDLMVSKTDADHEMKQQHVIMSDGTGASWVFAQYEYTRKR
jgi:hypothetical protein